MHKYIQQNLQYDFMGDFGHVVSSSSFSFLLLLLMKISHIMCNKQTNKKHITITELQRTHGQNTPSRISSRNNLLLPNLCTLFHHHTCYRLYTLLWCCRIGSCGTFRGEWCGIITHVRYWIFIYASFFRCQICCCLSGCLSLLWRFTTFTLG